MMIAVVALIFNREMEDIKKMRYANQLFRDYAKSKGVCTYEIAEKEGISESTLYRHLRREFSTAKLVKMISVVDQIAAERSAV